jgi:hypothetical protein
MKEVLIVISIILLSKFIVVTVCSTGDKLAERERQAIMEETKNEVAKAIKSNMR